MSATPETRSEVESPKRQAVLDAAGSLFMTQGYGVVSMDAIARAAGVSKATLYAHFASKGQLFATIILEGCRSNLAVEGFLPEDGADIEPALVALARGILRFLLEDRALAIYRVVMSESTRFPELGHAFYENGPVVFRRVFSAWLSRQATAGRLEVPESEMAADQFIGLVRGGVYLRASLGLPPPPSPEEIEATVAAAVRTFLRAYRCA
ncbi:MAG: TetR/AcrR family transcriptional regulator [Acetobacteraceae bacterium]|nr:TetR/AcrR family transcriptional regulator [Acetobacteraceae bacterium]